MDDDLQVTQDEPVPEPVDRTVAPTAEIAHPALKEYFNVDRPSDADVRKFDDIIQYFGDRPESLGEMMYMLRQLENRLGQPVVGQTRLNKLHAYIKVTNTIDSAEAERDSMLR